MLTYNNQGTISNVAITGAMEAPRFSLKFTQGAAAIAYDNHGTIENCLVRGLEVENKEQYSGSAYAVGISVFNQGHDGDVDGNGTIRGCYVEDLKYKPFNAGEGSLVTSTVISLKTDKNLGSYSNNYFRATYAASGEHAGKVYGTNVCTLTKDPTDEEKAEAEVRTPEFARKLAWILNDITGDKFWGLTDSDQEDNAIRHIALAYPGVGPAVAPIKVDFISSKPITKYYLPGMNELPKVPNIPLYVGWVIGGVAYDTYGDMPVMVELTEDQVIELALNPDEWPIMLSHKDDDSRFDIRLYQDVEKAMKDAEEDPGLFSQELRLRGNVTMGNFAFTVGGKTSVIFEQDAKFTMESGAQITNMGTIYFSNKTGSNRYHKYGTIVNYGHIIIDVNGFYNYGSIFDDQDSGRIEERSRIICRPHVNAEWTYADGPETEGEHKHEWKKTSTCSVCGAELTDYIKPDPPESRVSSIRLMKEPGKTCYEVGEEFTDEGMVVMANLTDGTRAVITDYQMLLKMDEDEETEIKNGDALNEKGAAKLTVKYGEFKTEPIDIEIMNTAALLTVTNSEGEEITEKEMEPGEELDLAASLKHPLPYKTAFKWETEDPEVAALKKGDRGKVNTVVAGDVGKATITVTVLDEKGEPIRAIDPKSVKISVAAHITDIEIEGGDISIDKGESHRIPVKLTPSNTTDKLKWTSSDEEVAAVDDDGLVTGVGGGKATITVEAPNGKKDSREVYVYEKAKNLKLDPETMEIAPQGYGAISAGVESARANGEIKWTIDDDSVAGFFVRNKDTGEMEVLKETVTRLSGDGTENSDAYVVLKGLKEGTVNVRAEVESEDGGMITKECPVTVAETDEWVKITHNGSLVAGVPMNLALSGGSIRLGAESSEQGDTFTWSALDDEKDPVLKVENSGRVTLKRRGSAVVKVTSDTTGKTDICMIKVFIEPTGVKLSDEGLEMKNGDTHRILATLEPEDAEAAVKWTSSDEKVVTVSKDGTVTALAEGTATITATPDWEGAEPASCKVTVTAEPKPEPEPTPDPDDDHQGELTIELSNKSFIYDGKIKMPTITVKSGNKVLARNIKKSNSKFMVVMFNGRHRNPGTYKIVVMARDEHYGMGEASFKIKVKPTKIKKVKKGRRSMTVKWKKVNKKYVKGYVVRYSTGKNMKNAKYKYVKKWNKTSLKIGKLKSGKKYYVQVRSYYKKRGVFYYSKWTDKKTVKPW